MLGYSPSSLARALVTRQSHIIGVIVGDIDDPYFSAIVRGIQDSARAHGYLTVVCNSDRNPETELDFVRMLGDYRADGLIFAGGELDDPLYLSQLGPLLAGMQARGTRTAGIGHRQGISAQVRVDNFAATVEMTEYLLRLGHRDIVYIKGPAGVTTSNVRFDAYRQTLLTHGLTLAAESVLPGEFTYESGFEQVRPLLGRGNRPTAIFAANDQMAIGALVAVQRAGLRVPADMSVVGFDDIPAARYVYPPLTTVRIPMYEMGVATMEELLRTPAAGEPARPRLLEHEMVIRESAGPAARAGTEG